jgi:hypothetical protein
MRERDELKRRFERSESEQVRAIAAERDSLNARLTAIQIDQGVTTTATKRGLRPTAIPDITARARSVFRLVEGAPRAYEADGQTVRVGKDGMTPMTLEEWVDLQVGEAPHLFESNAGGGAAGDASGGGAGTRATRSVRNPFRKDTWNLTEQMRLLKSDPGLAARLKARNPRSKLNVQSRMFKHSTRAGTTSFWPRPCPPRNPRSKLNVQSWMFDVRQKSSSTRFHFNPCRDHFLLAPPVSAA